MSDQDIELDRESLLWLYAAGALDAEDADRARALLDRADLGDVAIYSEAIACLAQLPEALPMYRPSAMVRQRVMALAKPAAPITPKSPAPIASAVGAGASMGTQRLAVIAAIAAVALAVATVIMQFRNDSLQEQNEALNARMLELNDRAGMLGRPGVKVACMENAATQSRSRVIVDTERHQVFVHAFHLKPLPNGRELALWIVPSAGKPLPVGTFKPDADGNASANFSLGCQVPETFTVAITEEPAGGSPQPTGATVVSGPLH